MVPKNELAFWVAWDIIFWQALSEENLFTMHVVMMLDWPSRQFLVIFFNAWVEENEHGKLTKHKSFPPAVKTTKSCPGFIASIWPMISADVSPEQAKYWKF